MGEPEEELRIAHSLVQRIDAVRLSSDRKQAASLQQETLEFLATMTVVLPGRSLLRIRAFARAPYQGMNIPSRRGPGLTGASSAQLTVSTRSTSAAPQERAAKDPKNPRVQSSTKSGNGTQQPQPFLDEFLRENKYYRPDLRPPVGGREGTDRDSKQDIAKRVGKSGASQAAERIRHESSPSRGKLDASQRPSTGKPVDSSRSHVSSSEANTEGFRKTESGLNKNSFHGKNLGQKTVVSPLSVANRIGQQLFYEAPKFRPVKQLKESTVFNKFDNEEQQAVHAYKALLNFRAENYSEVLKVLEEWLAEKNYEISLESDEQDSSDNSFASSSRTVRDGADYRRIRIVDKTAQGVFHTEIILASEKHDCWIWTEIYNEQGSWVGSPRFIKQLVGLGKLSDDGHVISAAVELLDLDKLETLVNYLVSPSRALPLFIARTANEPRLVEFLEESMVWSRESLGLARFVVLTPRASQEIESLLPDEYLPPFWGIRTFHPDVNLEDPADSLRHRFLSTNKLANSNSRLIADILGRSVRGIAAQRSVPSVVRTALQWLTHHENNVLLEQLSKPAPTKPLPEFVKTESDFPEALVPFTSSEIEKIQYLKQLTGVDLFDDDSVIALALAYEGASSGVIERVKARVQEQESELHQKNEMLELTRLETRELHVELMHLQTENQRSQSKVQYLVNRLKLAGDFEAAFAGIHTVEIDAPQNFSELVEIMNGLNESGVIFTGDEDITVKLDEIDSQGQACQNAWLCFNALCDFIQARNSEDFQGSIFDYLKNPPENYKTVSVKKYAARESDTTMAQYGHLRQFRVPPTVDLSGCAEMSAHFKLGKIGMVSPRMHLIDNFDNDGNIYIGYIGPHLRTAGTN